MPVHEESQEIEIVPGVRGPERLDSEVRPGLRLVTRFDRDQGRYVPDRLTVDRPTTEGLRHVPVKELMVEQLGEAHVAVTATITADAMVTATDSAGLTDAAMVESRGLVPPDGVTEHGPTDRALRWVAHFYRWGYAVSYGGTKAVEELLGLPRSTAGRWVEMAREAGYLGPAEGPGKPGI
jgi:hypothetical protein